MLALDARLAGVVRAAREPMLAQIRLAWWRDRLLADPADWPRGEPVLAALNSWGGKASVLAPLVDGWEALLGEPPLAAEAYGTFAEGRGAAMAALAERSNAMALTAESAGRLWGLADLALHLGNAAERAAAAELLNEAAIPRLVGPLRPLAVLAGLSLRAVRRGRGDALDGPGALLAAIRLGFTGR